MAHPIPCKGGFEMDFLPKWHKYLTAKAGKRKSAKRKYNKRVRKQSPASSEGEGETKPECVCGPGVATKYCPVHGHC